MKTINDRVAQLRADMKMNQTKFGKSIGLSTSGISSIENGTRKVTDQHIKLICSELNVNEEWLRSGTGEVFVQSDTFSLDEKAKIHSLTELEIDIIQSYMELKSETRLDIISWIKGNFDKHSEKETAAAMQERKLEEEVEIYRAELRAEQKGATLSALDEQKGKSI